MLWNDTTVKLVFLSNYFNHHQRALSDAFAAHLGGKYVFIETTPMPAERKQLGYSMQTYPDYVIPYSIDQTNRQRCRNYIDDADIVIVGSAPHDLTERRIRQGKLLFRYAERPLKEGDTWWKFPFRLVTWRHHHPQNRNLYLLTAGAYTAADYAKYGLYRGRCYRFGYFPPTERYDDIEALMTQKEPMSLLWVGRFLDWKHPEAAIAVARRLKNDGYRFVLRMIGCGEAEEKIKHKISALGLEREVSLCGAMSPEAVRRYMEQSEIVLCTSDRHEGWGSVINEAMNSACAVAASHAMGAVPDLIRPHQNGMIYHSGHTDELYSHVKWLIDHPQERMNMAINAYDTVIGMWNAENAAERFLQLVQEILSGKDRPDVFGDGVCSKASIVKDHWYHSL